MIDKDKYMPAFQLISIAGEARSNAIKAIQHAKEGHFDVAEESLAAAENGLTQAHSFHMDLLAQEAGGDSVPLNIILIHALDHLTMAIESIDNAKDWICLYRRLEQIQNKGGGKSC